MKKLIFDCGMGAAGDMLMGALFELSPDPEAFLRRFAALELPGVTLTPQRRESHGVTGTQMHLHIDGSPEEQAMHHHHTLSHVQGILAFLPISAWVRRQAMAIYNQIAEAESAAHGVPVSLVHFHEVGALDAIGDIIGVCMLLEQLEPETISATAVHVGQGSVHCAHGILPVPAPATARLLEGIPTLPGPVEGELCTPTGAALLRHFVTEFGTEQDWTGAKTGCGIGSRDFGVPNCVYAHLLT